MKVSELIESLKECDPNAEIRILFPLPNRPFGGILEPIFEMNPYIDQDSNKTNYVIDTGIGEEGRYDDYCGVLSHSLRIKEPPFAEHRATA